MGSRVLEVAPGRTDLAAAGVSTAVNVGISAGALIGGLLLSGYGVRSTALTGGLITVVAVALAILERRIVDLGCSGPPEQPGTSKIDAMPRVTRTR
jgi:DHA1 family inner membrane transport protein